MLIKKLVATIALCIGGLSAGLVGAAPAAAIAPAQQVQEVTDDLTMCQVAHHWKKCGPLTPPTTGPTATIGTATFFA